jgi:hypothetical protein
MPYNASITDIQKNYITTPPVSVGSGQCVAFVQTVACAPHTPSWKRGAKVAGNVSLPAGTAIATFDPSGRYGNHTDGRSHAAIYVSQTRIAIIVYDQWLGQPVHQRSIRIPDPNVKRVGTIKPVNDGSQFYVIG